MIAPNKIIEKLFGVKINNKINFIINFFLLFFIISSFWLIPKYSKKQSEKIIERWNKSEFSGIVDSLYNDHSNHGSTIIVFSNGSIESNLPQSYTIIIKKGDSLYKIKNNDTIFLKRENEIIKLE